MMKDLTGTIDIDKKRYLDKVGFAAGRYFAADGAAGPTDAYWQI
jgi:hypothetical protein